MALLVQFPGRRELSFILVHIKGLSPHNHPRMYKVLSIRQQEIRPTYMRASVTKGPSMGLESDPFSFLTKKSYYLSHQYPEKYSIEALVPWEGNI